MCTNAWDAIRDKTFTAPPRTHWHCIEAPSLLQQSYDWLRHVADLSLTPEPICARLLLYCQSIDRVRRETVLSGWCAKMTSSGGLNLFIKIHCSMTMKPV